MQEKFVLVEMPNALYAGFNWTLTQLQNQSISNEDLAFLTSIAPSAAGASPAVLPPVYAMNEDFYFQLDPLRKLEAKNGPSLTLNVNDIASSLAKEMEFVDTLCSETTLDRGQASALCQNLCRGFAFTQGPPGTGKT